MDFYRPESNGLCLLEWPSSKWYHDLVGMDADEEEVEPVAGKRVRKETGLASGKLDKDEPGAKLKKRTRVLVEELNSQGYYNSCGEWAWRIGFRHGTPQTWRGL
ncbi:uncharacterized protein LOC133866034 isoform X1 [Alnus glutinosa]|uniref:uncharacterized protein LOC133866034 isoform X1 n=1 Tax=Alnus glutinosa TaxID=3517 RepID=UPI002D7668F2|nr:uncharacterized protein LOC133866034 isoform X1 [Alnus glutinosa]